MLKRGEYGIYQHYQGFLLPILLGNIYGALNNKNMHWEDAFFKYMIDQKMEGISDVDWDFILKEKPFLTRQQISQSLKNARISVKVQGPLHEQIAAFRNRTTARRSSPKWIEERKLKVNQIYDDMKKANLKKTI